MLFNDLLRSANENLTTTRFLRHSDRNAQPGCSPLQLWRRADGSFERYQSIQNEPRFDGVELLASFVRTELGETLFVGTWRVHDRGLVPAGTRDPVRNSDVSGHIRYDLRADDLLAAYRGRIVIDWGAGNIVWCQSGENPKSIIEVRREAIELPFPGYLNFNSLIGELPSIPTSWREILLASRGVYVLTCSSCGKQYVGSASGANGLWGRWLNYVANGHGGNQGMRPHEHEDYHVSILEVAGSTSSVTEIIEREELWKLKLQTRSWGLNL